MIRRVLKIGRWVVDFLFAVDEYDIDGVLACMYDAGASDASLAQAEDLMTTCDYNCGLTYSDASRKRAVVLIGPTTSGEEFTNTLVHEVHHLAVAIASGLGVDLEGETPAYVAGDAAMSLADVVCELGCRHCR